MNEASLFERAHTRAHMLAMDTGYTQPLFSNLSNTAYSHHTCTLYAWNNNIRSSSYAAGQGSGCTSQKPRYLFGLRINHGTKRCSDRIRTFLVRTSVRRWKGARRVVWVVYSCVQNYHSDGLNSVSLRIIIEETAMRTRVHTHAFMYMYIVHIIYALCRMIH